MRLLLVKTSSMGDVIHTMPAVTDAVKALPGIEIDWIVEKPFASLAALHPAIAETIPVETRRWRRSPLGSRTRAERAELRRRLKSARYDLVLDAQGLLKSALLARMAGAPVSGLDRKSAREGWASFAYSARFAVPRDLHAIERTRRLFAQGVCYEFPGGEPDFGLVAAVPSGDDQTAFLIHGTSWETKKWPAGDWIDLARHLVETGLTPRTTWGDESERAVAEEIARAVPQTNVLPKSDLAKSARAISAARIVVGVDTGLTHIANAYDRPTVALFLASRPGLTGPVGRRATSLTAPDVADGSLAPVSRRDRVSGTITVEEVVAAVERLLSET